MIFFPLDITEYEADALGAWCGTRTRGVYADDASYAVTPAGGMSVTLSPGYAWLKKEPYWGVNAFEINPTTITFETADGALTRFAAVCIQLDKNANGGGPVVKYGPLGVNPQVSSLPLPEQTPNSLDYEEIYVAAVRIRAGATEILQSDIFDLRLNETYCGIMRDGVTGIPTQALYDQWWAWFEGLTMDADQKAAEFAAWMVSFRAENEAAFADWLAGFKTSSNTAFYTWYGDFTSQSESVFNAWFQNLQDQLDDNQAGNLQNQIDQHKAQLVSSPGGVHGFREQDGKLQVNLGTGWATFAELMRGLRSTYIDAQGLTSYQIDGLMYTSTQIDTAIEMEV
ncbi:hypothetical protein LJC74_03070 [Eubacteriales bacterium OttesenSCG-928-A19]|nr:hypothetical protein [Eubacteriales bacterium OttesenSCG-928-A19]